MFLASKPVIGMLHIPALPGSPLNRLTLTGIIDAVLADADALAAGGVDGLILENFGDVPFYPSKVPPHTVAFLTRLGAEVRRRIDLPLGINVLRNDAEAALAVATAVSAAFIRVNIYTGARLTDQGLIQGSAHRVQRYRKALGSPVQVWADVDVKHSVPLAPRSLEDEIEETLGRGCADAIIVTGRATGQPAAPEDLARAKAAAGKGFVLAGSGVDPATVAAVLEIVDGVIVGSAFKLDGRAANPVDAARVRRFIQAARHS